MNSGFWQKSLGVFSSAAFCIYSWTLLVFLWELPSFLLRFGPVDILAYAAYQFMFALIETLVVTILIACLSLILPAQIFRDTLHISGTALVLALALTSLIFKSRIELIGWAARSFAMQPNAANQLVMSVWLTLAILLPVVLPLAVRNPQIARRVAGFVNSLSVLVGLYVALSAAGILVVIVRNLN